MKLETSAISNTISTRFLKLNVTLNLGSNVNVGDEKLSRIWRNSFSFVHSAFESS